ncbi:MAG: MFS transporter [Rhodospirillaceae bacterium]|nr:MFS transporter [Rhodospirillaceae bacterium]
MQINVSQVIDRQPVGGFQIKVVGLCTLIALLDGLDIQTMGFVIPKVAAEWNLQAASFGPVLSAAFAGIMLGAMIFGILGDRYGRRLLLIGAFIAVGVMSILTSFAESTTQLLILRFLTGLGIGGCMPNFTALAAEYVPTHRLGFFVTLIFAGVPLGGVFGGYIAGDVIELFGWRAVFVMGGVIPLIIAGVLIASLPESIRFMVEKGNSGPAIGRALEKIDRTYIYNSQDTFIVDRRVSQTSSLKALFSDGRAALTLGLWVVFFFSLCGLYLLTSWLPSVLTQQGWPMARAIQSVSFFFIGGAIGGLVIGELIDRFGAFRVLATVFLSGAALTAAIGRIEGDMVVVMTVIMIAGFSVVGGQTGMTALAAHVYPTAARATGVGWGLGVGRLGAVVGPAMGGLALSAGWSRADFFLAAALPAMMCTGVIMLLWIVSRRERFAR